MAMCLGGASTLTARAAGSRSQRNRELNVMTRNMYLGTDFAPILSAGNEIELVTEVARAYANVQTSRIPERASAVAAEIEAARPDLVGLQEVALWRTGAFGPVPQPQAANVTYDALQSLLEELRARGLSYAPVAVLNNFDAEVPAVFGPTLAFNVRFTDRDVVLARLDLRGAGVSLENVQMRHFVTNFSFATPALGVVTVPRGWISVDAKKRGKQYRFVSAHLESFHPLVQFAQASELIHGPARTALPVVFAGDFNSNAESLDPSQNATYQLLLSAGFRDAWDETHPDEPGYTWPLHGNNPFSFSTPTERLDLVLSKGDVETVGADVVGEEQPADLTLSGLWPSDHAGVVASFHLKP
jgi:endonuclease/exonuclease/phosphatase family metal-dependent hydrolase